MHGNSNSNSNKGNGNGKRLNPTASPAAQLTHAKTAAVIARRKGCKLSAKGATMSGSSGVVHIKSVAANSSSQDHSPLSSLVKAARKDPAIARRIAIAAGVLTKKGNLTKSYR